MIQKRIEKAQNELNLPTESEIETEKIHETSIASFFKVSSMHLRDATVVKVGKTISDPMNTLYKIECTVEEYHQL